MAKPDVLERVKSDLARGRTHLATQRLRTFLAAEPNDLDVRCELASIYRRIGNLSEAGRWAYLTRDVGRDEIAAFERANPSPWVRLRLLQFTADPEILSEDAQARLAGLTEEAERVGPPDAWTGPAEPERTGQRGITVPCLFVLIALTVFAVLTVIGVYRAIVWVWNF